MKDFSSVKELMTTGVLTVTPQTPLIEAIDILLKKGFNGLPVADKDGRLVGILTEYDLTIRGSSIYLPTFLKLLKEFKVYKKDKGLIREDFKKITAMKVGDIMNSDPLTLPPDTSIENLVKTFAEHHRVNPIPIVDNDKRMLGIISRSDLIKLFGIAPKHCEASDSRALDSGINKFLGDFEKEFVFVTKFRTRYWLIFSLIFLIVGFSIAMLLILRFR